MSPSEKSHLGTDNKGTRLKKKGLKEVSFGRDPSNSRRADTLIKAPRNTSAKRAAIPIQIIQPTSFLYSILKFGKKENSKGPRQAKVCFCVRVLHVSVSASAFEKWEGMVLLVFISPPFSGDGERNPIEA